MNKPLPVHYYTSLSLQMQEEKFLFNGGPKYRGHNLMVPESGNYISLPHTDNRWILTNDDKNINLLSNVCLHRQAKLVEGRGSSRFISCRVHSWTYKLDGTLKSAPHFKEKPEACLRKKSLNEWNGLLFEDEIPTLDLKAVGIDEYINFSDYFFHGIETTEYQFNWKTFAEVYLENYHVYSMHPGLRKFVKPTDLEWHFDEGFSVQKVGIGSDLNSSGSKVYEEWQYQVKKTYGSNLPRYGAIWIYIYPNIMIEWYPNVIAISTIYPKSPTSCVNHVELYYKKNLYEKNPDYYRAIEAVYSETAKEDEEACILLDEGRRALYSNGESEIGYTDSFLEAGVDHFYQYIHKNL